MSTVQPMSQHSDAIAQPALEELVGRARGLLPLLKQRARDTEINRRVSADTTQQIAAAGLFKLVKPKRFGGFEFGPSAMLRVGFELGQACGSTAWCTMLANCNSWFASYWPLQAQADLWGAHPENLLAGTVVPTGVCEVVKDGYLIRGRWPWASNCENSQWLFVSAMLPDTAGAGWFLVPAEALLVDQSTWHVSGMQGTGSKTVFAEQALFVPEHRMIRFNDIQPGNIPGAQVPDNIQARFSFSTFGAVSLIGPILGMAQGALDWFVQAMQAKVRVAMRPGSPLVAAQSPFIQERVGRASAAIDASVHLLLTDLLIAEAKIHAGETLDIAERIKVRRDIGFGARQAVEAVSALYEGAGASGADLDSPIQRHWRDINAATRHVSLDVQAIYGLVGQQFFGMQPVGMY